MAWKMNNKGQAEEDPAAVNARIVRQGGSNAPTVTQERGGVELIEPVRRDSPLLTYAPGYQPEKLPAIVVEADRPIIDAVTMRRTDPGQGSAGEAMDLVSQQTQRLDPMSMRDAAGAGLFDSRVPAGVELKDPSAAFRAGLLKPFAERPGASPAGVAMGDFDTTNRIQQTLAGARAKDDFNMSTGAGRAMGEAMDLTRPERWGQSGPTRGARFAEVRDDGRGGRIRVPLPVSERAGTQDRAQSVLEQRRRIGEANAVPQAVAAPGAGVAMFDPRTGKWDFGGRNEGAAPAGLGTLDDQKVLEGLSKFGRPDKMRSQDELTNEELERFRNATTQEEREAVRRRPWRDDDQAVYRQYEAEARRRGLVREGSGGGDSQSRDKAPVYREGQQGVFNGKGYVFKNGKWTPA